MFTTDASSILAEARKSWSFPGSNIQSSSSWGFPAHHGLPPNHRDGNGLLMLKFHGKSDEKNG